MLTAIAIQNAKPAARAFKLFDGGGLYLLISPNGRRGWRLKYRFEGREKLISLGTFPEVSLQQARERRDAARRQRADGVDPSAQRKVVKAKLRDTFELITCESLKRSQKALTVVTYRKRLQRFQKFVFPYIGRRPIRSITAPDFLAVLRRIETRGLNETAHRVRSEGGQVFRYAIACGLCERDVTADLRGALAPVVVTNHAALTDPAQIGALMIAIDAYRGQRTTEAALKLAPLVFLRPGELRKASWSEFQLEGDEPMWRLPAERMKKREPHVVPLARQAVEILKALHPLTGPDGLVFPSIRSPIRPISENTVTLALRTLGYSGDQMTAHGFRAMASTCLNEQGFAPDLIELQLSHAERNEVRAAYNRAQRLTERRVMMQQWANYLDQLRAAARATAKVGRADIEQVTGAASSL